MRFYCVYQFKCQQFFFKVTTNQNFDIIIMIVILLNMTTMAMEHHDEPQQLTSILNFINQLFIAVFALECVMKQTGSVGCGCQNGSGLRTGQRSKVECVMKQTGSVGCGGQNGPGLRTGQRSKVECVMKLLGLRLYYFKQPWNVFDFCVVVMSILGIS